MRRLSRRIRECEAAIGVDRRNLATAVSALRAGVRRRAGSPRALGVAFGGGLVLGLFEGGRVSAHANFPSSASMVKRFAREALWPLGMSALRVQLRRVLDDGAAAQRR
ncbi:hypothetical protein [Nitrococcus mobilis]|uniref:hypothetical protein n=1 Tax=Nitrococcus mobilis TaxID=35797 RepID=UPI00032396D2|nr:hypothetical protein [Nitrococcus mobilis]